MGFTNTQYANTIAGLVEAAESKLANPYYKFADKKPTPTTYYKQNKTKSTLDQGSQLQYAHVSKQSALKYNKILGFYLYGVPQIALNYDIGDNGVEADMISGDAIILPNTIEPLPGDFFAIDYIKEDVLQRGGFSFYETEDLEEVMPELDILYMTRVQRERFFNEADYIRLKDSYILTPEKLLTAKQDLAILHPLPRVGEIAGSVDDDPRACYFKQALYGKYMRMALILMLLEVS